MSINRIVEFDNQGKPLVTYLEEFASKNMLHILVVCFCFILVNLGLQFSSFFMQSPLLIFIGAILGFLIGLMAWIPAFLLAGIVAGNFDFQQEVFSFCLQSDFRTAVALAFLLLPLVRVAVRAVDRTAISFVLRKWLFVIAFLLGGSAVRAVFVRSFDPGKPLLCIFSCLIMEVVYILLFWIQEITDWCSRQKEGIGLKGQSSEKVEQER